MSVRHTIFQFTRRPFVRNVLAVAGGTAVAQGITMAFSPIVTRLYGPEAYGIQGVFMSVAGILGTVAAMNYPIAIVLPKSEAEAFGLARLSIYIGIGMSMLAAALLFLYGSELLDLLNAGKIAAFIYLIPVFMLVSVVNRVASQWLIRKKAFALTARIAIWQALLINSAKAGLGFAYPAAIALIVMNILNGLLGTAMALFGWRMSRAIQPVAAKVLDPPSNAWTLAKNHRDFPLYRTPQELLNTFSHSLPVMMLATCFGPSKVGFFSIASGVLALPAGLIGTSVMQVFYPRINEAIHRGEDAKGLIVKATLGLALSGALPFLVVIAAGPMLFGLVFGAEWETAGVYAQWLSLWLFFQYINKPAVSAIPALGLQRGLLVYELFSTGTKVLALYLGYVVFKSDVAAIALFSGFGVVAYAWLILWVIVHSGKPLLKSIADTV
ncbi:lipopolysaccharide biosynthesis protein [Methylococcus capsulatus]|uniref:lipopolysaccharide biosynthesis protein n=1 Tax=Methylococcus capsulatus TaxID=414 RepID=UPI001C533E32|nr:oligosaccharide flippase family protein [Methylococcus capsulatus]QXP88121.1 oligosaccharide flippase family protein [Methylococcus capsulatus]QXP90523.1 oligosaccharide flippase family protein [Methylococcus capsulatus]UQN13151.1 oligosaccharide flippase family protein [Methylococcus capsulatus]